MGAGSLVSAGSWALAPPHDARVQGILVSGFLHLDVGVALMLRLDEGGGGAWLGALLDEIPITPATGRTTPSAALALTITGLQAMGLDRACVETFSPPFVEGMRQIDRQRRLGDDNGDSASIPGGPLWSGNAPDHAAAGARATPTEITVHAALLLYDKDAKSLSELTEKAARILAAHGVEIVRRIELGLLRDGEKRIREHFGFVDGISQPVPYGPEILQGGQPAPRDSWHAIPVGDILLGHRDAYGEPAPGPIVRRDCPGAELLPQGTAPYGFRDLGLDGAYMVIRELRQDVGAFWRSLEDAAKRLDRPGCDAEWLAARVVGRTRDGEPLRPPKEDQPPPRQDENAFGFADDDFHGLACPLGSHMRRANPRDGLAPKSKDGPIFLQAANNHRILRRGRKFGPPHEDKPDAERGLLFVAINTDFARQFEFIQQTWMLNRDFATLFDETDPLVGARGAFTVPADPIRARVDVDTFVRLVGGDYFFLPSLPALAFLAHL